MHAKATSPVPVGAGDAIYSLYDADRVVTGVRVSKGDVVLSLQSGQGVAAASTLGYFVPNGSAGDARNVMLNLTYTITQNAPVKLTNGRSVSIATFTQGHLVDPEVDQFSAGGSDGVQYRVFTPNGRRAHRPLIVWLHGNGEGGLNVRDYYSNEPQLRANRGAVAMASPEAQRIFNGAYVVAPAEAPIT